MRPRVLECPDGVARLVTLQNWSWDALDFMVERESQDRQAIIDFCWNIAKEHDEGDADYQFAAALEHYIHQFMSSRAQAVGDFANDDCVVIGDVEGANDHGS
jgi:predicted DNA-binding ribbon-helix-helix protein